MFDYSQPITSQNHTPQLGEQDLLNQWTWSIASVFVNPKQRDCSTLCVSNWFCELETDHIAGFSRLWKNITPAYTPATYRIVNVFQGGHKYFIFIILVFKMYILYNSQSF